MDKVNKNKIEMGIPGLYAKWIRRHDKRQSYAGHKNIKTEHIITRRVPKIVSSLSVDMNGLFHSAAQMTYAYGNYENIDRQKILQGIDPIQLKYELFSNIGNLLLKAVIDVNPTDLLVIAVDGIAPVAKMDQQRKRRFIAAKQEGKLFDKNLFTPGTQLMFELDVYLRNWIETNRYQLPPHVIYSSHMVPGEGEHKIFQFMREGKYNIRPNRYELRKTSLESETYIEQGAHVIYGLDADLIMLSVLAPLNKIFLKRENLEDIIIIDNLKRLIDREKIDKETFVILSFLIGNDFLPHQPALEDVGHAFDEIITVCSNIKLHENGNISWENFKKFLDLVIPIETKLLVRESKRMIKYPSKILLDSIVDIPIIQNNKREIKRAINIDKFTNDWNNYILSPRGDARVAQKLGITDMFYSEERLKKLCFDYLDSLNWTFNYYKHGLSGIDPLWFYAHHYTPLFRTIKQYIDEYIPTKLIPLSSMPYNPIHQLLAILPRSAKYMVPVNANFLMDIDSPIIDMYPDDFIIDFSGKNAEYSAVSLLPHVNILRIIWVVEVLTSWTPEQVELYTSNTNIENIRKDIKRYVYRPRPRIEKKIEKPEIEMRLPRMISTSLDYEEPEISGIPEIEINDNYKPLNVVLLK